MRSLGTNTTANLDELEREGRTWARYAVSDADLDLLTSSLDLRKSAGQRLSLNNELNAVIGRDGRIHRFVQALLPHAHPVRMVAFNKTKTTNWSVPWHQDRVIAVHERRERTGFSNWSRKAGVWHCEPPTRLLEQMCVARIHLDDADGDTGGLELALGSHTLGRIAASYADAIANGARRETCRAKRGDILFVKALLLHRSRPTQSNANRRALRIDYTSADLPPPLRWAWT